MSYNGWSNYETWNVALWIDNDKGTYNLVREQAREFLNNADQILKDKQDGLSGCYPKSITAEDSARYDFAQWLKDFVNEMAPDLGATMYSDLLSAALSDVDWDEIVRHWLDDVGDEMELERIQATK